LRVAGGTYYLKREFLSELDGFISGRLRHVMIRMVAEGKAVKVTPYNQKQLGPFEKNENYVKFYV
jgi:hypothetical protein